MHVKHFEILQHNKHWSDITFTVLWFKFTSKSEAILGQESSIEIVPYTFIRVLYNRKNSN